MFKPDPNLYEVVSEGSKLLDFYDWTVSFAWKELGIDAEHFKKSDKLVFKNAKGEPIGTLEVAVYDVGYECEELEQIFPFKQYQNENTQLVYMDKIAIHPNYRKNPDSLARLFQTMLQYMYENRNTEGKKQVITGLLQDFLFNFMVKHLDVEIKQLTPEPIDGEVPVWFDVDKQWKKLMSEEWIKIKKERAK